MKKCISCNKEIEDLYHQCPHCGGETFIQSSSAEDSSSWYDSMAKQTEASKLVDKSVKLIMAGKYTEAENILKKAIEINPYNATAHGNMGGVFHKQGRFEEAVPWFEKALELNPNLEGVPEALKEVKAQIKKSKLITGSKEKPSRKTKIQNVESLFNEGTRLYTEKQFEEAEIKLKEALNLDPASEDIMYNLALVYLEKRQYNLAWDLVDKIKEIDCNELIQELKKTGFAHDDNFAKKSNIKCPACGHIMDESNWRCPECYCEFENYDFDKNQLKGAPVVKKTVYKKDSKNSISKKTCHICHEEKSQSEGGNYTPNQIVYELTPPTRFRKTDEIYKMKIFATVALASSIVEFDNPPGGANEPSIWICHVCKSNYFKSSKGGSELSWTKTILIGSVVGTIAGVLAGLNFGIVGFIILVILFSFFKEKLKPRSRMIIAIITAIITGGVLGAIIRISSM